MAIKSLFTFFSTAVLSACVAANAASESVSDSDYRIQVFKDCEKVKDIAMSAEQESAYHALKNIELDIKNAELPVRNMEQELAVHQAKLAALSKTFKVENDDVLTINKKELREYKQVAREMEHIVRKHEADIRAIEHEARKIERASKRFEHLLRPSLAGLEHDQVQVIDRKTAKPFKCYQQS